MGSVGFSVQDAQCVITAFIECLGLQFSDPAAINRHSLLWSPQLPTDKKQVWFFRWRHQIQPTGSSSCCHIPTILPRSGAPLTFRALSVCPCSGLTWKVLLCPQHWAVFSSITCWAGCAQSNCCSCLSCFSSRLPSLSFSSKAQREGLCKHTLTSVHEFVSVTAQEIPYPTFFPNKSTNKLGNLKTFMYVYKNNVLSTVFTGHFLGYLLISAWS